MENQLSMAPIRFVMIISKLNSKPINVDRLIHKLEITSKIIFPLLLLTRARERSKFQLTISALI